MMLFSLDKITLSKISTINLDKLKEQKEINSTSNLLVQIITMTQIHHLKVKLLQPVLS
jgi:hypothetical protein